MSPDVAVIVINWNASRVTARCVASLVTDLEAGILRLIVVDNGSSAEDSEELRTHLGSMCPGFKEMSASTAPSQPSWDPRCTLIRSESNLGYAAGNNLGIREALRGAATRYVMLLNNDTVVQPGSIGALRTFAASMPGIGVVSSTVVEHDGHTTTVGASRFYPLLTVSRSILVHNYVPPFAADYVSGCAFFITLEALRAVGLLCEDYFLYFEELDFCRRVRAAGLRLEWCSQSTVHHDGGHSTGSRAPGRRKSALAEYHSNLSCLIFMRRYYPKIFWIAVPLRLLSKLATQPFRGEIALSRVSVAAYLSYFRKLAAAR